MPKGTKSVRRWFRVLAVLTICLALFYTVTEALDSTAITDSSFEFEALTLLTVIALMVALIQLILLLFRMLIWGSNDLMVARAFAQRCREAFSVLRPPGPLVVPLRI